MFQKETIFSTINLVRIALMAAVLCILSPISLPLPFTPIPLSLGVLAVLLTSYVLPPLSSLMAVLIFLLIGAVGMPVFSGYAGGFEKLSGPTGGYLIGFLFLSYICACFFHGSSKRWLHLIGILLGLAVCYLLGTAWFSLQQQMGFFKALSLCVLPFLPGDCLKIIFVLILGPEIQKRIQKAAAFS